MRILAKVMPLKAHLQRKGPEFTGHTKAWLNLIANDAVTGVTPLLGLRSIHLCEKQFCTHLISGQFQVTDFPCWD